MDADKTTVEKQKQSIANLDSLMAHSSESIISRLGEKAKSALLQALIDEKSKEDKEMLYQMLGDVLYDGIKLSDRYTYGIFCICQTDKFIEDSSYLTAIYNYLDNFDTCSNFQIMFVQSIAPDDIVRFDCARVSRKIPLPPGDHPADYYDSEDADDRAEFPADHPVNLYYHSLAEHPEARLLHETLKARKTKDGFDVACASIVVRFRDNLFKDDGNHVLIGEEWGPGLGLCVGKSIGHGCRHDIDTFSEAIEHSNHCEDLGANDWESEFEFSITMKGEKCQVLYRSFECPGE